MKKPPVVTYVRPRQRAQTLAIRRNRKMARSVHAYVRGNTARYYEWLADAKVGPLPEGPAIWICGDCHTGNLGPVANDAGEIEIQIRDLDQTVIGNPVHDLIRLSLSLATAARSSDLPGIVTARIIEQVHEGYMHALAAGKRKRAAIPKPDVVRIVMRTALERTWKHLARERLMGVKPVLPLGKRFWPLSRAESNGIAALVDTPAIAELAVGLRGNRPAEHVELLDAAYWVKGCSSLGRLRYAVLLDVAAPPARVTICAWSISRRAPRRWRRAIATARCRATTASAWWKARAISRPISATACARRRCPSVR